MTAETSTLINYLFASSLNISTLHVNPGPGFCSGPGPETYCNVMLHVASAIQGRMLLNGWHVLHEYLHEYHVKHPNDFATRLIPGSWPWPTDM